MLSKIKDANPNHMPFIFLAFLMVFGLCVDHALRSLGLILELRLDRCVIDEEGIHLHRRPKVFWLEMRLIRWEDIRSVLAGQHGESVIVRIQPGGRIYLSRFENVDLALSYIQCKVGDRVETFDM